MCSRRSSRLVSGVDCCPLSVFLLHLAWQNGSGCCMLVGIAHELLVEFHTCSRSGLASSIPFCKMCSTMYSSGYSYRLPVYLDYISKAIIKSEKTAGLHTPKAS
jgi:hypothetical protein